MHVTQAFPFRVWIPLWLCSYSIEMRSLVPDLKLWNVELPSARLLILLGEANTVFTLDTVFLARNLWPFMPSWNRASTRYWGERERAPHLWIKRKIVYLLGEPERAPH